ncbi:hypothetical protein [Paenibacillus humicola]|uniref:hypothetical protein n=1 Tax=Paenibacillus humicola TaxID=3110540 RepID=UPI00237C119B|nr:hypothetical protein [Paenibacillus humicola]
MLTFEQKQSILDAFPELERKPVSLGRINYHYEGSLYDKKTVVYHLHPNGNGYVYAGLLQEFPVDDRGFVNIRDFGADELRRIVAESIRSLSQREEEPAKPKRRKKKKEQHWTNTEGQSLVLKFEDDLWYVYAGLSLESVFETFEEAEAYLREEGFSPAT